MERLHQPGDIIVDRYRIVAFLGKGTFSNTYEAEDLTNHKCVALKAVSLTQMAEWQVLDLLQREAKVLGNLHHPAIPSYLNYFTLNLPEDRCFYLVQELVNGESLASLVNQGWRADEEEVKSIAIQILEILDYLHNLTPPVIHRDIKPQNIVRRRDGKVFLVDFGAVQDVYRNTSSCGGTFAGTLGYMPPEQFRGQVGAASDLYGVGATLLFLLTGRSPDDFPQHRLKVDFRRWVKGSWEFINWLEKLLEPAIENRFTSAKEALESLVKLRFIPRGSALSCSKPLGTKIVLTKTNRRITIKLPPPQGWLFWFGLFWNLSIILLISGSLLGGWLAFSLTFILLIPWLIVGWLILQTALSTTYLEIDKQKFFLQWQIGKFIPRSIQGKTADIEQIELEFKRSKASRIATSCLLWQGVRKHRFGSQLREENEWLVAELKSFLGDR
ncbi:MAG: serine/threonine-protein kinase [Spirulinaceae cyanobacterium]